MPNPVAPVAVAVLLCLPPGPAPAGAWPADRGSVLVSVQQTLTWPDTGELQGGQNLYAEYGLTDRLTLGVRGWRDSTFGTGSLLLFARLPLPMGDTHKFAVELAVGAQVGDDGGLHPVVQPAIAWGTGFESVTGPGWIGAEALHGREIGTGRYWTKGELTLGLKPTDRDMAIVNLRAAVTGDRRTMTVAPRYVRRLRQGFSIELGADWQVVGGRRLGVTAGTWIEF